jgi:ABC-type nitrate/sulfonate/bicarbonate transport system substrate-binding protein
MSKLIVSMAIILFSFVSNDGDAQTIKMNVAQAGVNPGTSLYFIAQKENLFVKHGLEVKIVDTTTPAAVQAMLGGSMDLTLGAGPAFTNATLAGSAPFVVISSWINVFPYMIVARKEIAKIQDLKGKTGQVGATFGSAPDVALRFGLSKLGLDPEKDVKLVQMPRPDWANVIAQIEKGDVQFSVLPPPYDRMGEKRGFRTLFALPGDSLATKRRMGAEILYCKPQGGSCALREGIGRCDERLLQPERENDYLSRRISRQQSRRHGVCLPDFCQVGGPKPATENRIHQEHPPVHK